MIKLFMLYAILIFAKKAPKMIAELLKLSGDGVGLKGLNIKNKLGEAALVGGAVKKGLTAAEGGLKKGLGAGAGLMKQNAGKILGAAAGSMKGSMKTAKGGKTGAKGAMAGLKGINKASLKTAVGEGKQKAKDTIKEAPKDLKKVGAAAVQGANDYKDAKDTKGAFRSGIERIDPTYQTSGEKMEAKLGNFSARLSNDAELLDDKQAANINKRKLLGMGTEAFTEPVLDPSGVPTMNADGTPATKIYDPRKPVTAADMLGFFAQQDIGPGATAYADTEAGFNALKNGSTFKGMSEEAQLTVKEVFEKTKSDDFSKYQGATENLNALASTLASLNQTMSTFSDEQKGAMSGVTNAMQELKNATTADARDAARVSLNNAMEDAYNEGVDSTFVDSYVTTAQAQQEWTEVKQKIEDKKYTTKDSSTGGEVIVNATNIVVAKENSSTELASIKSKLDTIKNPPKSS